MANWPRNESKLKAIEKRFKERFSWFCDRFIILTLSNLLVGSFFAVGLGKTKGDLSEAKLTELVLH